MVFKVIPNGRMVFTWVKGLRVLKGVLNTEKTKSFNDTQQEKTWHTEEVKCILMARVQRVRKED